MTMDATLWGYEAHVMACELFVAVEDGLYVIRHMASGIVMPWHLDARGLPPGSS